MFEFKKTVAWRTLWPTDARIFVRVAFLYVGQGASSVIIAANGSDYHVLLVDVNLDRANGGIDVPRMMKHLLGGGDLHAFVNTHPHDDHLNGVVELHRAVTIKNVWHSGHIPSRKHGASYGDLKRVIQEVKQAGGGEKTLAGSNSSIPVGSAKCHILAPAEYVTDVVNEDEADARYRRIHEQCAVLKFGDGTRWIMIPGDADRAAFEKHITRYHKDHLSAIMLAASHHGSRDFFREDEETEPYTAALENIAPSYVVVSAPKQRESEHGHPHDDALELYEEEVGRGSVFHTGNDRRSFIFDIYRDGSCSKVMDDAGALAKEYGLSEDGGGKPKKGGFSERKGPTIIDKGKFA